MSKHELLPPTSTLEAAAADPSFLIEQGPVLSDTATHPWYVALHLAMARHTRFLSATTIMQRMNHLQGSDPAATFGNARGQSVVLVHWLNNSPDERHFEVAPVPHAHSQRRVSTTGYRLSPGARETTPLVATIAASYIGDGPFQHVFRYRDLESHEGPYGSQQARRLRGLLALLTEGPQTNRSLGDLLGTSPAKARQTMELLKEDGIVELERRQSLPGGAKSYDVAEDWRLPIGSLLRRLHSFQNDNGFRDEAARATEEITTPGPLFQRLIALDAERAARVVQPSERQTSGLSAGIERLIGKRIPEPQQPAIRQNILALLEQGILVRGNMLEDTEHRFSPLTLRMVAEERRYDPRTGQFLAFLPELHTLTTVELRALAHSFGVEALLYSRATTWKVHLRNLGEHHEEPGVAIVRDIIYPEALRIAQQARARRQA